jgi:hypothetical protein
VKLAAALLVLAGGPALAVEWPVANPGRPSFSANAPTTAKGALELETGVVLVPGGQSLASTLKYGLLDTFDLRVNWGQDFRPDTTTDLSLQVKWMITKANRPVLFAVAPYVGIPTSSGSGWDLGNVFIAEWDPDGFSFDGNVVVDVAGGGGRRTVEELEPVITVNHGIAGDLGGYLESHAEAPLDGSKVGFVAAAGLGYTLFRNLVLDAALDVGLDDVVPRWQVQFGLTFSVYAHRPR